MVKDGVVPGLTPGSALAAPPAIDSRPSPRTPGRATLDPIANAPNVVKSRSATTLPTTNSSQPIEEEAHDAAANDLFVWQNPSSISGEAPKSVGKHVSVSLGGSGSKLLIFGGFRSKDPQRVWEISIDASEMTGIRLTWSFLSKVKGTPPEGRVGFTATSIRSYVVIFGGENESGLLSPDIAVLDVDSNQWIKTNVTGTPPCSRVDHSAVCVASQLYIFGGRVPGGKYLDDMHVLSVEKGAKFTWKQVKPSGNAPSPRAGHSMTVVNRDIYVFGGCENESLYQDFNVFNVDSSEWSAVQVASAVPLGRLNHSFFSLGDFVPVPVSREHGTRRKSSVTSHHLIAVLGGTRRGLGSAAAATNQRRSSLTDASGNPIDLSVYNTVRRQWTRAPIEELPVSRCWVTAGVAGGQIVLVSTKPDAEESLNEILLADSNVLVENMRPRDDFVELARRVEMEQNRRLRLEAKLQAEHEARAKAENNWARAEAAKARVLARLKQAKEKGGGAASGGAAANDISAEGSHVFQFKTQTITAWQRGELLGQGAFGSVYLGLNLEYGSLFAVKQMLFYQNQAGQEKFKEDMQSLQAEINLMKELTHENIVQYYGTEEEEDEVHYKMNIFMEYVPGGSIAHLLIKFGRLNEAVIRVYTRQLLTGLEYLHNNGILHRDIKGANVLVDNNGQIKLADFGCSKRITDAGTPRGEKSTATRYLTGTPYWMAPEVIRKSQFGRASDIWSVACVIIEMATGKPPFSQFSRQVAAMFHIASSKTPPPMPECLSKEAHEFIGLCMQRDVEKRPSATDLLKHNFVNSLTQPT